MASSRERDPSGRDRSGCRPASAVEAARGIPVQLLVVAPNPAQLTTLLGQAASGALDTTIEKTYPLDRAADAHQHQAAGRLKGRIVLIP